MIKDMRMILRRNRVKTGCLMIRKKEIIYLKLEAVIREIPFFLHILGL